MNLRMDGHGVSRIANPSCTGAGASSANFDHPVDDDALHGCRAFLSLERKLVGCRKRGSGGGESKCPDKSQYTLFNPTPANCLREFDPDRPGAKSKCTSTPRGYSRKKPDEHRVMSATSGIRRGGWR